MTVMVGDHSKEVTAKVCFNVHQKTEFHMLVSIDVSIKNKFLPHMHTGHQTFCPIMLLEATTAVS